MTKPRKESLQCFENYFKPLGLEMHFFKVSWYNELVDEPFKLKVSDETVCAVLISIPSFFEDTFLPYVRTVNLEKLVNDPVDSCVAYHVTCFQNYFSDIDMIVMYDYELLPNRRPKVLVQTAAHASGAAFYYQKKHVIQSHNTNSRKFSCDLPRSAVKNLSLVEQDGLQDKSCSSLEENIENFFDDQISTNLWKEKRIFGCCIHPLFGGWFAIRSVIIFSGIKDTDSQITYTPPVDCVPSKSNRIELLNRFNDNWQDCTYRDIIPVKDRYSDIQKFYFTLLPKDRKNLLVQLLFLSYF